MIPPPTRRTSGRPRFSSSALTRGKERHVGAGEDGEADDVDVFLHGGLGDHLGGLVETGVDDLHAVVAEDGGDGLRAAVVSIEAGLGG